MSKSPSMILPNQTFPVTVTVADSYHPSNGREVIITGCTGRVGGLGGGSAFIGVYTDTSLPAALSIYTLFDLFGDAK